MAINNFGNDKAQSDFANISNTTTAPQPEVKTQTPPPGGTVPPQVNVKPQNTFAEAQASSYTQHGTSFGRGLLADGMEYDIPYSSASTKVQAFLTEFEKAAEEQPALKRNRHEWEFMVFDGPSNQVIVSALLFIRRGGDKGRFASVYAYLVQDTNEVLQPRSYQGVINGIQTNFTIPQITEELITSDTPVTRRILEFVEKQYAGKIDKPLFAGALVLPPELEPNNSAQIARTLFYGNAAAQHMLYLAAGAPRRLTLREKAQNESLGLKLDFNAGSIATSTGLPVRSDVSIKLMVQRDKQKQTGLGLSISKMFSITNGYMTLMYTGQGQMPYNVMMAPAYNPMFKAGFVITALDNQFGTASLESQLLALSTASVLAHSNYWYQAFQPNYSIQEPGQDPKDLGLITLDANYQGEPLAYTNTKENGFPFPQFMAKYLHQDLMFFIDVPELGDLTYLQRAFLDAAGTTRDVDVAAAANAAIVDAANYLTDGEFSKYYNANEPVVYNQVDRVESGYFINEKGEMKSLAEIDYLYLLSKVDVDKAREMMDSFNQNTGDPQTRYARRQAIYDTYFPGWQIRGFNRRLTVNPNFLLALGQALNRIGGNMAIESYFHQGQTVDRTYHNQILGIGPNAIQGFVQGSLYANNGQQNGTWRNYAAPFYYGSVPGAYNYY